MSDEPQHDETQLPEDAVEDLTPEDAEQDVSGGAVNAYLKYESLADKTAPVDTNLKW